MSTLKVNAFQDTSGRGFYPNRAWLCMNGSGTVSIRNDGNFSSVTDITTGQYSATMSNALAHANYATNISCSSHDGNTFRNNVQVCTYTQYSTRRDPTTTVIYWHQLDIDGGANDDANYSMVQITL